jgi:hypothetical protein
LPLDETLERRVKRAKSEREAVLVEMAGRRFENLPHSQILPSQVEKFSKLIRAKLSDLTAPFAKDYLRAVVDEVVVADGKATISGSHARLMAAAVKKKNTGLVPNFMHGWHARRDSNSDHLVRSYDRNCNYLI